MNELQPQHDTPTWPGGLPPQTKLQKHLHAAHMPQRVAIIDALNNTNWPQEQKAADRMANCCNTVLVSHDTKSGQVRPWLPRCGSRLCPFCGRGRTARIAKQVHELVHKMKIPRHICLTRRTQTTPLGQQVNELRAAFSKFRRHPQVAKRIVGGVYTIEITRNARTGNWHPHLHLLADGSYFPQKLLSNLWREHIAAGQVTWIRAVDDTLAAAWEIVKYIGKPPPAVGWPPQQIRDYAQAVAGKRMMQTFGTLHGTKLPEPDEKPAEEPVTRTVALPRIAFQAAEGIPVAVDLVVLMWSRWPMLRSYLEDVAPVACQADALEVNPQLRLPRPPRLGARGYGPHTDPKAHELIDCALELTMLLYEGLQDTGELDHAYEEIPI